MSGKYIYKTPYAMGVKINSPEGVAVVKVDKVKAKYTVIKKLIIASGY